MIQGRPRQPPELQGEVSSLERSYPISVSVFLCAGSSCTQFASPNVSTVEKHFLHREQMSPEPATSAVAVTSEVLDRAKSAWGRHHFEVIDRPVKPRHLDDTDAFSGSPRRPGRARTVPDPVGREAPRETTGSDTTVVATASAAPQTHWLVAPVSAIPLV